MHSLSPPSFLLSHSLTLSPTFREQDLESKFKEAFSQSLTVKDERIGQLEARIEEMTSDNSQLRDEMVSLKQQNEKLTQLVKSASPKLGAV